MKKQPQSDFVEIKKTVFQNEKPPLKLPPIDLAKPPHEKIGQVMGQMKDLYLESQILSSKTDEVLIFK